MSLYLEQQNIDTWYNYKNLLDVISGKGVLRVRSQVTRGHPAWNKMFDTCQIKGCENKHRAKGLCVNHYYYKYVKNTKNN